VLTTNPASTNIKVAPPHSLNLFISLTARVPLLSDFPSLSLLHGQQGLSDLQTAHHYCKEVEGPAYIHPTARDKFCESEREFNIHRRNKKKKKRFLNSSYQCNY